MYFKEREEEIKGRKITFRNAKDSDAEQLITFLKLTSEETPFLIREPKEITVSLQQERTFIQNNLDSERNLLILAFDGDRHIGNCAVNSIGTYTRYAHRCEIAIALYQKYCGRGIGKKMMELALEKAAEMGYEQAELEVAASNENAVHLYESLGFRKYGTFPDNMKYQDGSYEDSFWMMRKLAYCHLK